MKDQYLLSLLKLGSPEFWNVLARKSEESTVFEVLISLSTLRKRAEKKSGFTDGRSISRIKIALVGDYSFYPLDELIRHFLWVKGYEAQLYYGRLEIVFNDLASLNSDLQTFSPNIVFYVPNPRALDTESGDNESIKIKAAEILKICELLNEKLASDVLLCNFPLPAGFDPGPCRSRTLNTDWSFRKALNLELGMNAPSFVQICDLEFLSARMGLTASRDDGAWFESKQIGSPDFLVAIAREVAQIISMLKGPIKKVLVTDLDNTLWGGVIGDDGLNGIELGGHSARGEAFQAFQRFLLQLTNRGILLAVCSKNEQSTALEPFQKHPEMAIRLDHISSFYANWDPKPDNLRRIAQDLNVGLDSIVFLDDNPAEIEIVRQLAPAVTPVLLNPDPALFVSQIQDSRLFERIHITQEDLLRSTHYKHEKNRVAARSTAENMKEYLSSLKMCATIHPFQLVDVPRISQLINKSNQFNLTTRRRSEAEVKKIIAHESISGFSFRLKDRFGDFGLVSVVILEQKNDTIEIDTWLMSCRALGRQLEDEVLNFIMLEANLRRCGRVIGTFIPSEKNSLVKDHYLNFGFTSLIQTNGISSFEIETKNFTPRSTEIQVMREFNDKK